MKLKIEFHGFRNLVIWLWKNVGKALETFLKDSVRTLISVTLSFTLTVTPFSLKVQEGGIEVPCTYKLCGTKLHKKNIRVVIGKVRYYS